MSACMPRQPDGHTRVVLDEASAWLERRGLHVAAMLITRLGSPRFAPIGTASVRAEGARLLFQFDPDFWSRLTTGELVGVLAHEAMHVLLRHLDGPHGIDAGHHHLWNLAADAVVNDRLNVAYPSVVLPADRITGMNLIGRDCADLSAEDVLRALLTEVQKRPAMAAELVAQSTLDIHAGWGGSGHAETGTDERRRASTEPSSTGDHENAIQDAVGDIVRAAGGMDAEAVRAWGCGSSGSRRHVDQTDALLNPATVLARALARLGRPEPSWAPPNPKLAAVYPQVILPRWISDEKPHVLVAIDASASVSQELLSAFVAVAQMAHRHAHVDLISFDAAAYPLGDHAVVHPVGGGGTSFQAIEDYAVERLTRYPDMVLVLTDGYAPRPKVSQPRRWAWLIPQHGTDDTIKGLGQVIRTR